MKFTIKIKTCLKSILNTINGFCLTIFIDHHRVFLFMFMFTVNRTAKPFMAASADRSTRHSYGTSYGSPNQQQYQQQRGPPRGRPAPAPDAHAPPTQTLRHDDIDSGAPWKATLRNSDVPKPWELEQQAYVMPAQMPERQEPARSAPTPRVQQRPPAQQQQRQVNVRSVANNNGHEPPADDGARVVHLQYNSPIGLYSSDNIHETFDGQVQGQGHMQ